MTTKPPYGPGTLVSYLSPRSVRGYPYLAEAQLMVYVRKDGVAVWKPIGPMHRPNQFGVPHNWFREGTKRAELARAHFADAPKPWSVIPAEDLVTPEAAR